MLGHSGCGKSTLLRAIAGLLRPLAGQVVADGRRVAGPAADRALVFQDDALLPWRTARRNVELPLAMQGVGRAERRRRADEWLDAGRACPASPTGCPASSPAGCGSGCSSPARSPARPA